MKIYLASSWSNPYFDETLQLLADAGHMIYNFREKRTAFDWSMIDPAWREWTVDRYLKGIQQPRALEGYRRDKAALDWCDACVLLLPSGRSAHLELGYCVGAGKQGHIILPPELDEADLMNLLVGYDHIHMNTRECLSSLETTTWDKFQGNPEHEVRWKT